EEVFRLGLHASLVVLPGAAAPAKGLPGEGAADLARAFHHAGARDVIAALWQLPPPAAPTPLPQLLAHLDAGQPAAEALRAAKLEALQSGHPQPAFWAPWVLIEGTD